MTKLNECHEEIAAYHEAGHAVVAVLLGQPVQRVYIEPLGWTTRGECVVTWPQLATVRDGVVRAVKNPAGLTAAQQSRLFSVCKRFLASRAMCGLAGLAAEHTMATAVRAAEGHVDGSEEELNGFEQVIGRAKGDFDNLMLLGQFFFEELATLSDYVMTLLDRTLSLMSHPCVWAAIERIRFELVWEEEVDGSWARWVCQEAGALPALEEVRAKWERRRFAYRPRAEVFAILAEQFASLEAPGKLPPPEQPC
jgi:hypothetical protein